MNYGLAIGKGRAFKVTLLQIGIISGLLVYCGWAIRRHKENEHQQLY